MNEAILDIEADTTSNSTSNSTPAPEKKARFLSRTSDVDRHVGARIRQRRIMLGLSQQQLAELVGVTYQQAHKYERGINRISAGRLYVMAQVLGVPVGQFFEGLEGRKVAELSTRQRMCLELARNFASITNERHQSALSEMARALASEAST
jgi:transcriptional regulator with XRE-family HTH domain